MTHVNLPGVPDYTERVTVYCTDRIIELVFPSPYLRHLPTRLTVRRGGDNHALETIEYRASYEEAFREELRAFHAAATGKAPVQTTVDRRPARCRTPALRIQERQTHENRRFLGLRFPSLPRKAMLAWCAERGVKDVEIGVGAWGPWPRPHLDLATIGHGGRARSPQGRAEGARHSAGGGQCRGQSAASRSRQAQGCAGALQRGGRSGGGAGREARGDHERLPGRCRPAARSASFPAGPPRPTTRSSSPGRWKTRSARSGARPARGSPRKRRR